MGFFEDDDYFELSYGDDAPPIKIAIMMPIRQGVIEKLIDVLHADGYADEAFSIVALSGKKNANVASYRLTAFIQSEALKIKGYEVVPQNQVIPID